MAHHFYDNVYTKSFTPREYQVELLDNARERNIIVCLATMPAKVFIGSKLIIEMARDVRRKKEKNQKYTVYACSSSQMVSYMSSYIRHLTDLNVASFLEWDCISGEQQLHGFQVLVMTTDVCVSAVMSKHLNLNDVNLLILDQCQNVIEDDLHLRKLMKVYGSLNGKRPRLLGFTPPLLNMGCNPSRLQFELQRLEKELHSSVETASDIVSVLRYCARPTERVIECGVREIEELDKELFNMAQDVLKFLEDHRYDPYEIYPEEFKEDLQDIPDPKIDPIGIIHIFLDVLKTLGPYCADRAALILLIQIEKLKVKTPYERHFLLLMMVSSVLVKIRAVCDHAFHQVGDREKIYKYSSPKIIRLLDVLKQFKPERTETNDQMPKRKTSKDSTNSSIANGVEKSDEKKPTAPESSEDSLKPGVLLNTSALPQPDPKALPKTPRGRHKGRAGRHFRKGQPDGGRNKMVPDPNDPDVLCGVIFVRKHFTAKILFFLLTELRRYDEDLSYLGVQYTIDKMADPVTETKDAEQEYRKQEEVLTRFRMHECNLLIATSVLEEGIDIPRCNLVVRFDPPLSYRSYVQSKGRARAPHSHFVMLVETAELNQLVQQLAEYMEIEQVLLSKCAIREAPDDEEQEADLYNSVVDPFCPGEATATVANAISLVNRYCAKLPSDTFTKLTPLWTVSERLRENSEKLYRCTLRLPINSPVKQSIVGLEVPNATLARRLTALETIRVLHKARELDDALMPIGKESFRLSNEEAEGTGALTPEEIEEMNIAWDSNEARPGTTKRRQYYYKRISESLTDCRPVPGSRALLYHINMLLTCPLPEEQNTRGRKIYPPEDSPQGFGILTLKEIPKICPFPIFTRSGEVCISLEYSPESVELTEEHVKKILAFLNYTFTSVLRLQKYMMMFDPNAAENSYFVVPTRKATKSSHAEVDWEFLDRIYDKRDLSPQPVSEDDRKNFVFDPLKYQDAVVMPWYRNQDQPQYFYVAEICKQLSPKSSFPSSGVYLSFEHYYFKKYRLNIQNKDQPLLDVDHTSARLNFLTPRYVNRKGVALPTSSEETKRAKRENLEQKQILVPELCTVHPFPASLWRKAVCLPCILYRINALLLADEIRRLVAFDIGLGSERLSPDFDWKPLNFGWSLAEVLRKSRENKAKVVEDVNNCVKEIVTESPRKQVAKIIELDNDNEVKEEDKQCNSEKREEGPWVEIGTWSNDVAVNSADVDFDDVDHNGALPGNVTMLNSMGDMGICEWGATSTTGGWDLPTPTKNEVYPCYKPCELPTPFPWRPEIRHLGKPESSLSTRTIFRPEPCGLSDSDATYSDVSDESDYSDSVNGGDGDGDGVSCGLRIEFKNDNTAEALEDEPKEALGKLSIVLEPEEELWNWHSQDLNNEDVSDELMASFKQNIDKNITKIFTNGCVVSKDKSYLIARSPRDTQSNAPLSKEWESKLRAVVDLKSVNGGKTQSTTSELVIGDGSDSGLSVGSSSDGSDTESGLIVQEEEFKEEHHKFSFDAQPHLEGHPGPSPAVILQALTMSNANDGINLERLETIGDSFLKYAITTYLYCTYDRIHEGKLSHLRSKQVSNLNLYRLGRRKLFGQSMIATKFEPHDNWLPPCYYVPKDLEKALIEVGLPASHWNTVDLPSLKDLTTEEIIRRVNERKETLKLANINAGTDSDDEDLPLSAAFAQKKLVELHQQQHLERLEKMKQNEKANVNDDQLSSETVKENGTNDGVTSLAESTLENYTRISDAINLSTVESNFPLSVKALEGNPGLSVPCFIPYNLITQHSIPDKSIADCVEALIGAYLISCGPRGALLFMAWLGIQVLPREEVSEPSDARSPRIKYGALQPPKSPLLRHIPNPEGKLEQLLDGFEAFERQINYRFNDRSYLLQSLTHASYTPNNLTDCYQRLEFLGDAVLDYLITRHLYEDWRQHSPGALTDLRSALVNNTIFASLSVRFEFHKYFRHLSPGLNEVIDRFVRIQEENGHAISEEYYLIEEEECEEAEDVEVPKALGDVFESVAGAIFLDSGMSLDAVWRVYYRMMRNEIEQFSTNVPKSPIRELLELEPETAKFGKPEKLADGRRVRVTVEVFSKGTFKGIGRNYRIAKCTAAKCALKQLKKRGLLARKS